MPVARFDAIGDEHATPVAFNLHAGEDQKIPDVMAERAKCFSVGGTV